MSEIETRPDGARVTLDMIGSTAGEQQVRWSERETMLYALGVGAGLGDPERELALTTENTSGVGLRALPSFLTVLAQSRAAPALETLDRGRFLHAGQRIVLDRPVPASGQARLTTVIDAVSDKGRHAIIDLATTLRTDHGAVIGRGLMSIFVRGGGGFGGPRGTSGAAASPDRAPDARIVHPTRPEQALLYRLSGDRHRLHSDPTFARERGFAGPILHGLATYGFACRALVEAAAGGDPDRLRMMSGRFRKPVYPGDTLTTEIWQDGGDLWFRTLDGAGDAVIEGGRATIA